jgi:DNA-binding NtrC family response regulator
MTKVMLEKLTVLIIDDEISVADALEMILGDNGYDVTIALTGGDALEKINDRRFDIAITDVRLPDMSGLDVLSCIREKHVDCLVIVITAHKTSEVVLESKSRGAYEVLSKPFFPSDVITLIDNGLKERMPIETNSAGQE